MNIDTKLVRLRVEAKLKQCIAIAEAHYGMTFPMPTVSYDLNGRTAGTADYRKWHIQLQPAFFFNHMEEMIERTVPHEMAHLITDKVYPQAHKRQYAGYGKMTKRSVHGPEWRSVMRVLGVKDITRCHQYDTSVVARRMKSTSTIVQCNMCEREYTLGPKRLARLSSFWCKCNRNSKLVVKGAPAPQPKPQPKLVVTPETLIARTVNLNTSSGSKIDVCRNIFKTNTQFNRAQMIQAFVVIGKCTNAGAATYYATLKKEFGR